MAFFRIVSPAFGGGNNTQPNWDIKENASVEYTTNAFFHIILFGLPTAEQKTVVPANNYEL